MMWTTTGNLTNVKDNAKFEFGVAMLPAKQAARQPTGGGNFYLFKKTTPEQQAAALKFVKWMTTPRARRAWGIDTGYVAVASRRLGDAGDEGIRGGLPAAAVARDQLQYAVAGALDARQPARDQGA